MIMILNKRFAFCLTLVVGLASCTQMPQTTQFDESLPYTEIDGYKFHTEVFGDPSAPVVVVVHGGPGGDFEYLKSLKELSHNNRVIFYDQRGTGLSPREDGKSLTLERNLEDLKSIIQHFSEGQQVMLIGHSWGGMLVAGYLSAHPERVSHAIIVEPGMLYPRSAKAFVDTMKESQSFSDIFALVRYMTAYPFVGKIDQHEGFDYVLTKIYNRSVRGGPYQCVGESMPPNSFLRGGYAAFSNMLKPVMNDPAEFRHDLIGGISNYNGKLMLISSECSQIGYDFQKKYHIPRLPRQVIHVKADNMGHNMLTLNPQWSLSKIRNFFAS